MCILYGLRKRLRGRCWILWPSQIEIPMLISSWVGLPTEMHRLWNNPCCEMRIVVWFLPSCITASTGYSYTTGNVECFRHNLTWSNTSLCWHSVTDHLYGTWFYDTLSFYNVKQSSRCDPSFILPNLVSGFCPCRPEKYIRMFFFLGTDRFSCETMNMFSLQPFSDQLTPEIQIYIPPHYISHTHTLVWRVFFCNCRCLLCYKGFDLYKKKQLFNILGFISITMAKNEQLISFIRSSSVTEIREWNQLLWR